MIRPVISFPAFIIVVILLTGCAANKRAEKEKKGLMLLETTQLGRNKGYYSKHRAKTLNKDYRKYQKKKSRGHK
jgi:hypothetical protein